MTLSYNTLLQNLINTPSKPLIYVASPYSIGDELFNVNRQINAGEILTKRGFVPLLPLLSHFWHEKYNHEYDFWIKTCLEYLRRCDGILRLQGESLGADIEVEFAKHYNIPVFYDFDSINIWFNVEILD